MCCRLQLCVPGGADAGRRAIVFAETKRDAHAIGAHCRATRLSVGVLTGDHMQQEREATVAAFRAGTATLLVATDVAARGLDVPDVARVICFDFPSVPPLSTSPRYLP